MCDLVRRSSGLSSAFCVAAKSCLSSSELIRHCNDSLKEHSANLLSASVYAPDFVLPLKLFVPRGEKNIVTVLKILSQVLAVKLILAK